MCNCSAPSKVNRECTCRGKCRRSVLIYKNECKIYKMIYIVNTQNKIRTRMNGHFGQVRDLVNNKKSSDTFAKYFGNHFERNEKISTSYHRKHLTADIHELSVKKYYLVWLRFKKKVKITLLLLNSNDIIRKQILPLGTTTYHYHNQHT